MDFRDVLHRLGGYLESGSGFVDDEGSEEGNPREEQVHAKREERWCQSRPGYTIAEVARDDWREGDALVLREESLRERERRLRVFSFGASDSGFLVIRDNKNNE